MMFSKENRRFLILSGMLTIVICTTIWAMVSMTNHGNKTEVVAITAFAGLALSQLWQMIRQEQQMQLYQQHMREAKHHRDVIEEKIDTAAGLAATAAEKAEEIERKTNGNLTKAVHEVAEEVKKAALTPVPGQEAMPKTRAELEELMRVFAAKFCDDMVWEKIEEQMQIAFQKQLDKADEDSDKRKDQGDNI